MSASQRAGGWTAHAERISVPAGFLVGIALLALAGALDWITGPELASAVFYLPAIIWMTWKGGRGIGLGTAFASGGVWLAISLFSHSTHSSPLVPVWNALVRTTTFALVSILQSEIIQRRRAEQRLQQTTADRQKQAGILESILNSMRDGVVVADSQGNLLHINPAARRLLQIPPNPGPNLAWLQDPHGHASKNEAKPLAPENPLMRAARGENVDEAEVLLSPENAPEGIWLSVTGRPLRGQEGRITGGVIVFTDISARKRLERQIADASNREQRRLGEDLHDGLCQHLVSTAFAARGLASRLAEQKLPEAGDAAKIAELLSASIGQARDVARGLCLVPLETGGLASALEELAARTQAHHGIECQFIEDGQMTNLEETVATNLFRIAQEAVANSVKHGRSTKITITLSARPEQIQLEVTDNGRGIQPATGRARGMGMHLMNYRAKTVGAALQVEAPPQGGTRVTCTVPHAGLATQPIPTYAEQE